MNINVLPLLHVQRDLHSIPRGWERFRTYIATLTGGTDELVLPLVSMNPMGKEHVAALIDDLLNIDAEAVADAAAAEASARLIGVPGQLSVGLVVTDDAQGGWTNRYFNDMALRFENAYLLKHHWAVVPLWTSETWSPARIREQTLAAAYRAAFQQQHGLPETLAAMLTQEGFATLFAEAQQPTLDPDDLAYTRAVLQPYRSASDRPTVFACLYGDEAARSVGYPPLGLSSYAGFAQARAAMQQQAISPEEALLI